VARISLARAASVLRWISGAPIDGSMRAADDGYADAEAAFEGIPCVTRDLAQVDSLNEADDWPEGVPHRQADKTGLRWGCVRQRPRLRRLAGARPQAFQSATPILVLGHPANPTRPIQNL